MSPRIRKSKQANESDLPNPCISLGHARGWNHFSTSRAWDCVKPEEGDVCIDEGDVPVALTAFIKQKLLRNNMQGQSESSAAGLR